MSHRDRLPMPPSTLTGELLVWLFHLWRTVNDIPNISHFSGTTPNSAVTGVAGDLTINIGSASTDSRLWVKSGAADTPSTTGWRVVRVGLDA